MKREELEAEMLSAFVARFNAVRAGGSVRRYHTHRVLCEDTVASHSYGVAVMLDLMYEGRAPAHMLRAALYHDVAEYMFGDIPSPAKRLFNSSDLRTAEDQFMRSHGLFTELSEWERFVLKMADLFDGLMFCTEERERGNATLVVIWNTYYKYIKEKMESQLPIFQATVAHEIFYPVTERMGHITGCIWSRMEQANAQR